MKRNTRDCTPLPPPKLDISSKSVEEIRELTAAILARTKKSVDPEGIGFDAYMMATDDIDWMSTDDLAINDWWLWLERGAELIAQAATRFTIGLMASAGAIASSHMFTSAEGSRFAPYMLAVSSILTIWFIYSAVSRKIGRP